MLAPPRTLSPLSGAVVADALTHARSGQPALVVAGRPASGPTRLPIGLRAVVWQTPDGVQWTGFGEAACFAVTPDASAASVPAACQTLLREGLFGDPAACGALRGFGGLAFDPADRRPAPLGVAAPVAEFWVPEALWHEAPNATSSLLVAVPVSAGDDEASVRERWKEACERALSSVDPAPAESTPFRLTPPDPAPWHAAVDAALATIRRGDLGKVVLARAIVLEAPTPADPLALWQRLAGRAPATHRFLFQRPEGPTFLGASPERLFALEGRSLTLDGLAGTAPRSEEAAQDAALGEALLDNDKDRREHAFVVRAIADVLAPLVDHLSYPETPTLKRLPTVQHLHTPLRGTLRAGVGIEALLAALHPTPAVGGTPREAAIATIRELEPTSRGWYAGPVGWVAAEAAEFAVAIRSAYMEAGRAAVMTGAGIVAGSTPEGEWDETARKAAPLLRLLTEDRA